ncbi:hypothetical protein DdX_17302 [Ditylenchus destructor]|uniref:Uncharacterized protein n=1 Tax=Ditylenchus destructor TaxID=166010 RepID=A0AAD4MLY2_9BILA|nr:hypothetical protein DdX_17302 [Ditylenchus destructor]
MFKRKMRLKINPPGRRTERWLEFTQDCHFACGKYRNWRDERLACRKFKKPARFKKKSVPPEYASCNHKSRHLKIRESNGKVNGKQIESPMNRVPPEDDTKHIKSLKKKRLPQKKKPVNKNTIIKNALKSIRKNVVKNPSKLPQDKEDKVKPAPIGDQLFPGH